MFLFSNDQIFNIVNAHSYQVSKVSIVQMKQKQDDNVIRYQNKLWNNTEEFIREGRDVELQGVKKA